MIKYILSLLVIMMSLTTKADSKQDLKLVINGEEIPYVLFSFFVMPDAELKVSAQSEIDVEGEQVTFTRSSASQLVLKAPANPGAYKTTIKGAGGRLDLNILVMTPLSGKKGEYLNGYRIGNYPVRPLNNNPIYSKPAGLFEVTAATEGLQLSPHFNMSQFVCKQTTDGVKYLIVRERLLLKLEYLLELVQSQGIDIETFGFISGYRTPYYNKQIGNVAYSRHVWGGAADIFIDQDGDGQMDDLNKDGQVNERDVRFIYNLVEQQFNKAEYRQFRGGLGFYRKNGRHSGFIHVDVRGNKARW